jgi:hypothetical protein
MVRCIRGPDRAGIEVRTCVSLQYHGGGKLTIGSEQHISIFPMAAQILTKSSTFVGVVGAWGTSKLAAKKGLFKGRKTHEGRNQDPQHQEH